MTKKILPIWMCLLLIVLLNAVCLSQTNSKNNVIEANSPCAYAAAIFDSFAQNIEDDKTVIVISYEGSRDSRKDIIVKRLYNAKKHLIEYYKESSSSRPPDKVITAIGTDKTKQGKLEFYIDGRLSLTMFFLRNRNFALSSCYANYK